MGIKKPCKDCKEWFHKEELSQTGLCIECSEGRVRENVRQLRSKTGVYYDRYEEGMAEWGQRKKKAKRKK